MRAKTSDTICANKSLKDREALWHSNPRDSRRQLETHIWKPRVVHRWFPRQVSRDCVSILKGCSHRRGFLVRWGRTLYAIVSIDHLERVPDLHSILLTKCPHALYRRHLDRHGRSSPKERWKTSIWEIASVIVLIRSYATTIPSTTPIPQSRIPARISAGDILLSVHERDPLAQPEKKSRVHKRKHSDLES